MKNLTKIRVRKDSLFPNWRKLLCLLVVTSKTMDPALNQDQSEFGIFILPVPLQMLPNGDCFLDEVVQILRYFRSKP